MAQVQVAPAADADILSQIRERRIWYNDIEIAPGVSTRFDGDLDANPVLKAVDEGNRDTMRWLDQHLPADLSGASVLDLGCADGLFAVWAARRGASRVVGVERNRPNAERARWLCEVLALRNIEIIHGAAEDQLSTERFDHVLCLSLLYHLLEPLSTLHKIRTHCLESFHLASAIDLQNAEDAEPIARLDRYTTGAHGLWAFNISFVRQLLATTGFEITIDELQPRSQGARYLASCVPARVSEHHIFAKRIDQEFPINIERRRGIVRTRWSQLVERSPKAVVIFGAGTHTPWLLEQVQDLPCLPVQCIVDDRPPNNRSLTFPASSHERSLSIRPPSEIDLSSVDAVIVSSWHQTVAIKERAEKLFPAQTTILSFDPSVDAGC